MSTTNPVADLPSGPSAVLGRNKPIRKATKKPKAGAKSAPKAGAKERIEKEQVVLETIAPEEAHRRGGSIPQRIVDTAKDFFQTVRNGAAAVVGWAALKGYELYSIGKRKALELLRKSGIDMAEARKAAASSAWYAFQCGKYLLYGCAGYVIVTTAAGAVLAIAAAPVVILAGIAFAGTRLFAGDTLAARLTRFFAKLTFRAPMSAHAVGVV